MSYILKKKSIFIRSLFCGILFLCAALSGCMSKAGREPISRSGFYFDTIISITLSDHTKTDALDGCFALADKYERYFSAKIPDSDVSKINASGGKPVRVHEETAELIQKGLFYAKLSGGKFDITIGKLSGLWDFQAEKPQIPDAELIAEAVSTVNYKNISVNGNEVTLADPRAAIDLGGIAKGYIADKMKEYLTSQGIASGLINLGGNVLAIGEKENGDAYTIGIQKPFDETGSIIASVKIKDQTVVTSGTYERYFTKEGKIWHHILDTASGYPYENGLAGVSIICPYSVDGDALSTTCFALGLEMGMDLVETLEDTEAVFITSDGGLVCSSGIADAVSMQRSQ